MMAGQRCRRRSGRLQPPLCLLLLLAFTALASVASAAGPGTITYKLQHSFGLNHPFTDRGSVQVLIDKNTGALQALTEDDGVLLSGAELVAVEASARDAQGGWYRIRALGGGEAAAMTSVPMCDVVRAGFRENLTLTLDGYTGHLISLEYTPRMSRLSPKSCQGLKPLEAGTRFVTAVNVGVDQPAQSIPVVAPASARPPGIFIRFDDAGTDRPPEKSFFQKYWIFIVLAFLLLNTGGPMPEEVEGQRAGTAAGAGAGAQGQARVQGGAAAAGARQRRA